MKKTILLIIALMHYSVLSENRHCNDYLLLDGSEQIVSYGMDTTHHWWAVTQPFSNSYRLIIDGDQTEIYKDLQQLTFSADGKRWACFVKDNSQWYLLTNDTLIALRCNDIGEIQYSPNSQHLIYSFFESNDEYVIFKNNKMRVLNRKSHFYLSYNAEKIAWVSGYSNGYSIIINGTESDIYEEVNIFGFWYNGELLYSRKTGDYWEIYKVNELISDAYTNISEWEINIKGTVAAAL